MQACLDKTCSIFLVDVHSFFLFAWGLIRRFGCRDLNVETRWAQKGLWNMAEEKIMKARGELPSEGGAVREYRTMHEENFWNSWPREDERGKEEKMAKTEKNEERGEKRKREEDREENETVTVKRRCEGFVFCGGF